jgi:hypothetical protein
MPPVEHVPCLELVPCRAQNVLSRELRRGVQQRHHVLQLIAEPECAT